MKNLFFCIAWLGMALVQQACARSVQDTLIPITVLHTNDTHSCIMPINKNFADTTLAQKEVFEKGGLLMYAMPGPRPFAL